MFSFLPKLSHPPPPMGPMGRAAVTVAAAVGAVCLAMRAAKVMSWVKTNRLTHANLQKKYGKAGNWAVVTGASEGIGHAMTIDLARRGFNVCVIARTKSKLDAVVEELRAIGVEGLAIPFDFSSATDADWTALFAQLDKLEIGVLVNNVGINYELVSNTEEVDDATHSRIIRVNCESTVRMTSHVVPHMKAKKAGAIVILSSFSALTPTPMLSTYAGTKAFNLSFGSALYYELKEHNVDVLNVTPNVVVSKMTQGKSKHVPKETFLLVNADEMAHQTLDKLGATRQTAGHWHHAFFEALWLPLPETYRADQMLSLAKRVKAYAQRKGPRASNGNTATPAPSE